MKMKKILALMLALAMVLAFAACGSKDTSSSPDGKTYTVGIVQLVQHVALDAATEGFKDALKDELGDKVKFEYQNASNDSNACATIANSFVSKNVDLIMANATPALQAAANATTDIPILATSITEYGVALNIENFDGTVGGNISGTSDLAPLDEQAKMITEMFPDAKKVGLLYCSAEPNSLYQVTVVKQELEKAGVEATLYAFSDANDISAVCTNAVANSDVLYVPTDNTAASSTGIIDGICRPAGIPVVCGEEGICEGCGTLTLSIDYYDLGYATGLMAAKILKGEADISEMPIEYAPNFVKKYNKDICKELGITVSDDFVAISE